jgi:hypothetical protein
MAALIIPDKFSDRCRFPITLEAPALQLLSYVAAAYDGDPSLGPPGIGGGVSSDRVNALLVRLCLVEARRIADRELLRDVLLIVIGHGPVSSAGIADVLSRRLFAPWSTQRENVSVGIVAKLLRRLEHGGHVKRSKKRVGTALAWSMTGKSIEGTSVMTHGWLNPDDLPPAMRRAGKKAVAR